MTTNFVNTIFDRISIEPNSKPSNKIIKSLNPIPNKIKHNDSFQATEHTIRNGIGYTFQVSETLIGKGSYGSVYIGTDENDKRIAIKCCDIDVTGIPNILESSIMATMSHPFLNRALRIHASDVKLYIIQELAMTDLAQYTRREKNNYKPDIDKLKRWCYCLCQAVSALHDNNIIHADIKASNILLYEDESIRLTDYTLATKKWIPDEKFTHNVCTCTHRPLECLMKTQWDESLDIWSLGCTCYEIAYGDLLFPYQGLLETSKQKDKDSKIRLRQRSANAIFDWANRQSKSYESNSPKMDLHPIKFISYSLCDDFYDPEMSVFNDLLYKMLVVDPTTRPSIKHILSHPFFEDMKPPIYLSIKRPMNKISISEHARVMRYIQQHTDNISIQALAFNIYCRCNELHTINEYIRTVTCVWIASKIVVGDTPTIISVLPNQILSTEREICHNLLFKLHEI